MQTRLILTILVLLLTLGCGREQQSPRRLPNIVIIYIDDMGYADIGPFGADYPTPNLDQMAREGRTFTDFEVSSPVCSASRAALMTGAIHKRIGVSGAFNPHAEVGLNPDETTLAKLVREQGYATAIYGKWHLGHHPKFLPTNQGFDEYFGIPYSNDMWPQHLQYYQVDPVRDARKKTFPNLPLFKNTTVFNPSLTGEDQALLTRWYTERAVDFIDRNKDAPFFLYVPHSMVHIPLFASDEFLGKSGAGLYGDVVMELDWSVGEILTALRRNGIAEDTLVVFTSDNGPWLSFGNHAGSSGPFREGKGTTFEGGHRVPTVFWWPGHVPAGTTTDVLAATIDILPTVAALIGADPAGEGHRRQGHSITSVRRRIRRVAPRLLPLLLSARIAGDSHRAMEARLSARLSLAIGNAWCRRCPGGLRTDTDRTRPLRSEPRSRRDNRCPRAKPRRRG
jgi:arylsulfatase A